MPGLRSLSEQANLAAVLARLQIPPARADYFGDAPAGGEYFVQYAKSLPREFRAYGNKKKYTPNHNKTPRNLALAGKAKDLVNIFLAVPPLSTYIESRDIFLKFLGFFRFDEDLPFKLMDFVN